MRMQDSLRSMAVLVLQGGVTYSEAEARIYEVLSQGSREARQEHLGRWYASKPDLPGLVWEQEDRPEWAIEPEGLELAASVLLDGEISKVDRIMSGENYASSYRRTRKGPLVPIPASQCRVDPGEAYLWKGMLAPGNLGLVIGPPGCGKTLMVPYLGHCMARGVDCFGRKTVKGPVLYLAGENPKDLMGRVQALCIRHGDADLHILANAMNLRDENDHQAILAAISALRPVLVVVDTLRACMGDLDENDGGAMGAATTLLRGFTDICNSAVIAVHHTPKAGDTPRGHGVLNGDADVVMVLKECQDGLREISLSKNRNGSCRAGGLQFAIEGEDCGDDRFGEAIYKPVMVEETRRARGKLVKVGTAARTAYGMLVDMLNQGKGREVIPAADAADLPKGIIGVPIQDWKLACAQRQLAVSEGPESEEQLKVWKRAASALRAHGIIGAGYGMVWSVERVEGTQA